MTWTVSNTKLQFRSGYRAPRMLLLRREPALERGLHLRPLVVDDAVPGGVATDLAADEHVLAMDPLELGRQRRQSGARAFVLRIGLELDPDALELLERMSQEEVLRLDVRARPPGGRNHPRVPDLEPPVLGNDRQIARASDRNAVLQDRERVV